MVFSMLCDELIIDIFFIDLIKEKMLTLLEGMAPTGSPTDPTRSNDWCSSHEYPEGTETFWTPSYWDAAQKDCIRMRRNMHSLKSNYKQYIYYYYRGVAALRS